MADLNLHRDHTLGLARARKVALKWAEHVEAFRRVAASIPIAAPFPDPVSPCRSPAMS